MSSQASTTRHMRQSLASGLKNALEVYGHITPPNEHDDSDSTRFIGRCLVELNEGQQQYNERLQTIEQYARGSPYDGPTFSSQNDKIDAVWQEIGEIKSKVDNIEDHVQEIKDSLKSIEEENEKQFDSLESSVESLDCQVQDVENRLTSMEEQFERRFESLETRIESLETRIESLETRVALEHEVGELRQRNGLVSRLFEPVQPVRMRCINADGKAVLKLPTWRVRTVGYYWKLHNPENHEKLIDMHRFYELDFRDWACSDDEGSDTSFETDDLNLPLTTLERAVSTYPDRAVMVLFSKLGLVYSRFQEQVERQNIHTTVLQKRSPKDTSSKLARRVKRPSDGSTAEVLTELLESPTASGS